MFEVQIANKCLDHLIRSCYTQPMNYDNELKQIATLRETQGKEQETLTKVSKIEKLARQENLNEILVKLNWERSLVWQHIAMSEEAKAIPDIKARQRAIDEMEKYTLQAASLIEKNNLDSLQTTSLRFLGQAYRYNKQYSKAADAYTKAIQLLKGKSNVQTLELQGFLAVTLIMNGQIAEGFDLAVKTFEDFDRKPEAIALKEKDYVTWAIWKSGVITRLVEPIKSLDNSEYIKKLNSYLQKSEDILVKPEGALNWGDDKFAFRIGEINKAKNILKHV